MNDDEGEEEEVAEDEVLIRLSPIVFARARSLVLLKVKMSPYEAEISLADEV